MEERREFRRFAVVFLIIFVLFILIIPHEEKHEYYCGPVGRGYGPGYY
jgi:competence protein ComGC